MSPNPAPPRARRRSRRAGAFAGLGLVAMVVVGPAALAGTSLGPGALGSLGCASAADQPRVGLVVDFGGAPSSVAPPTTADQCVALGSGTGFDLLTRGGHRYTINGSDLLCSIDGYPASGCGVHNADGTYDYWSYWSGGSSWKYSSVGPGSRRPQSGDVDGWHFVRGHANPGDAPPGPSSAGVCPPPSTTTVAPTTTAPTGSVGPGPGATVASPAVPVPAPSGSAGASTTTVAGQAGSGAGPPGAPAADPSGPARPDETAPDGSRTELADGAGPGGGSRSASGSGMPITVAGIGLVIIALGLAAARRLRAEPED